MTIECSAWDLVGDLSAKWESGYYAIRIVGGRTLYETATNTKTDRIRLDRLAEYDGGPNRILGFNLRRVSRYINPETRVELVPNK